MKYPNDWRADIGRDGPFLKPELGMVGRQLYVCM